MSYRTYAEGKQIFGNNEYYSKWINFIQSQGIKVDEDGCYKGYITDVQRAIEVIEEIVLDIEKANEGKSIFDLSTILEKAKKYNSPITDELMYHIECGYAFMPINFINACTKKIERVFGGDTRNRLYNYKVKPNKKIKVSAG